MQRRESIQSRSDLTNQQKLFALFLLDHEDAEGIIRIRQKDIASALGIYQSRIVKLVDGLVWRRILWTAEDIDPDIQSRRAYWFIGDLAANEKNRDREELYLGKERSMHAMERHWRQFPGQRKTDMEYEAASMGSGQKR